MVAYDYRCRTCDSPFEVRRAMSAPAADVRCPHGHDDVARVWSTVAVTGRSTTAAAPSAGGCCGGGCCGGGCG